MASLTSVSFQLCVFKKNLISLFASSLVVAFLPVFFFFATFYSLGCSSHCNYGLISRPSPAKSEQNQQFSEVIPFKKDKYIIIEPPFSFAYIIGHWVNYKKMPIVRACFTYPVVFVIDCIYILERCQKDVHSQIMCLFFILTTLLKFCLELPRP